jgi:hypothetical protein
MFSDLATGGVDLLALLLHVLTSAGRVKISHRLLFSCFRLPRYAQSVPKRA